MSKVRIIIPEFVQCEDINRASCKIAKRTSAKWGSVVAGGIVWTTAYSEGGGRAAVQAELRAGLQVLLEHDIDLILVEVRQQGVAGVIATCNCATSVSISTTSRRWSGRWSWP